MLFLTAIANIIKVIHFIIISFIIIIPFIKTSPGIYFIHSFFCLCILLHWYYNNDICSLSIIESRLRGINYTQSYTHKLISPIYNLPKQNWTKICYIIVIILMSISIYKLITSKHLRVAKKYYSVHKQQILDTTKQKKLTLKQKHNLILETLPLLVSNHFLNYGDKIS